MSHKESWEEENPISLPGGQIDHDLQAQEVPRDDDITEIESEKERDKQNEDDSNDGIQT